MKGSQIVRGVVATGRRRLLGLFVLGAGALIVAVLAAGLFLRKKNQVEGFTARVEPVAMVAHPRRELRAAFAPAASTGSGLGREPYEMVAAHLLEGFFTYRGDDRASVDYPGAPSRHGREVDALEGFTRVFPFAAAWLGEANDLVETARGPASVAEALRDGLVAGTDPGHPEYWGEPAAFDTRIVEASDIALGLWIARDRLWPMLDETQRERVLDWLRAATRQEVFQGVWQLYSLLTARIVNALDGSTEQNTRRVRTAYERFEMQYRGDGWYADVPKGFDFYNAWGIHYALFWIDQVDPEWDRERIHGRLAEFAGFYKHLFSPHGVPLMGHSLCYRLAAPAPLVAASLVVPKAVSPGEAMRALDATWSYYIARGAIGQGRLTQGVCADDLALLDGYSGPASCSWSLRSLIVAYYADRRQSMFEHERAALPVERDDFSVHAAAPGWRVEGSRADGHVRLLVDANQGNAPAPIRPYGWRESLLEWLMRAPRRPDNAAALYLRPMYSTAAPLSACQAAR